MRGAKMYFGLLELKFLIVGDRSAEEGLDGRNTAGGVVFALHTYLKPSCQQSCWSHCCLVNWIIRKE